MNLGSKVMRIWSDSKALSKVALMLWCLFGFTGLLGGEAFASSRKALIVANSRYTNTTFLPNPTNDAVLLGERLATLGFQVDLLQDLTAKQFSTRFAEFVETLDSDTEVLFYYAGHGIRYQDENLLVGVDARLANEAAIQAETFPMSKIVDGLERRARASLLFWDACRKNPLATGPFYSDPAQVPGRAGNTLIMFSASPGQDAVDGAGRNSPFAQALARHLNDPDEIETVIKRVSLDVWNMTRSQVPSRQSTLTEDFYLNEKPGQVQRAEVSIQNVLRQNQTVTKPPVKRRDYLIQGTDMVISLQPGPNRGFNAEPPINVAMKIKLSNTTTIRKIRASPDGKVLALGGDDGIIRIVSLNTFAVVANIKAHEGRIGDLDFTPDGRTLLSVGWDGHARLWRVDTGKLVSEVMSLSGKRLYSGRINPQFPDRFVLMGGSDGFLYAADLKRNQIVTQQKFHDGPVYAVAYQPKGKGTFLSAGGDGLVKIRLPEGKRFAFNADDDAGSHRAPVQAEYDPTGTLIFTSGSDRKIRLWDARNLSSRTPLRVLEGHTKYVLATSPSSTGKWLASGGGDKAVVVWSLETGKLISRLLGHTADVEAVSFTPDGRFLISSSEDNSVRIWSLDNQETLVRMFFQKGTADFVGLTFDNRIFGERDSDLVVVRVDGRELSLQEDNHVTYIGRGISISEY